MLIALAPGCEVVARLALSSDLGQPPGESLDIGPPPPDQQQPPPPTDLFTINPKFPGNPDFAPHLPWPGALPAWVTPLGTAAIPSALALDSANNSYVAATFYGTTTIGSTTLTSQGGSGDVALIKLDTDGVVQWAKVIVATPGDDRVADLAVVGDQLRAASEPGSVLALDAGGKVLWDTPTPNNRPAYGVAVDSAGNCLVTGAGGFVQKLDAAGTVLGSAPLPVSTSRQNPPLFPMGVVGRSVSVDSAGAVYVSGEFDGAAAFGPHLLSSNGSQDAYVAKLDGTTGAWLWAISAGGIGSLYMGSSIDSALGIAADPSGSSVIAGQFAQTATFGATTLTAGSNVDIFVAAVDPTGVFQWALSGGGNAANSAAGIARDPSGNLTIVGSVGGSGSFGGFPITSTEMAPYDQLLAAKVTAAGQVLWVTAVDSAAAVAVAVDSAGEPYVVGTITGAATFGSTTVTAKTTSPELFVARMTPGGQF